ELFSFWGPNFIKNHNFDPSIQTKMTAVVWVIRALSIGIGLGSGVILAAVTVSPFFALFGIPALFLTEIITHYIWNINNIPEILELKESVNPINVEQEVENTGLSQDFIEMVGKNSADNGFISLYDAYSLVRQKNTVRRSLTGRGKIIKNNGYALGISTYYLGNGNVFEPVSGISDSESGINLCTYSDGYYEFQQDGTRIRTNEQYLEKIFEDCEKNNKEVYFFLPPNIYSFNAQDMQKAQQEYMKEHPELQQSISGLGAYQPGITKAEIEWLKKHPQYMKYVHFVVGSYTFLDGNIDKTIFKKYFNINNISKTFSSILSAPRKYMKSGYNLILQNKGVGSKEIEEIQKTQTKINFKNLINDIYKIIGLIEQTTEKYPENREKGMKEAEEILSENFTPEQLEIIDLLASTIFDSIKYVNATRNTSAVEFINIIYSLQNGLFNDNLLPNEGNDLKQHILGMLKHYVDISLQKKDKDNNILVKIIDSDETILNYMTDFLCDIIVKNNLIEKKKQEIEQRKINMKQFIDGVKKDDKKFATVMVCSANENRSAIWHIMFADFLERKNKKNTKVLSAGVFYDLFIRDEIKAKSLVDDYKKTLSQDERYQGINENIINDFKSRYIKYLKIPKNTQLVFIVAGEQHRAQLIKLGYDPNWIFLMSDFYSDDFKKQFKLEHETMGRELEENNVFSMSEFPDPFEKQILRQDLPELVKSLVEYVFKTKDDIIRETLPERFVKFTDDYNQFEHMEDLPSFAFTDDEKREATRELYEDEVSDMVREDHQFEFAANTKYLYILQNRRNKEALLNVLFRNDAELKFKLFALMYLSSIGRAITQQEQESINAEKEKILVEFKNQLETNSFKVLNNFDLRAYMMGIYLMLQGYSARSTVPDIVYKAFIINKDGKVLANSDGYFAGVDLFTIIHELTHVIVGKPGLYNHLAALTVDELVSYITPNMFLSIVKLSLQAYSKMQSNYTIHQTDGVIDYVKMGKKLHVLYNLFSERVGDRELKLEEHIAPIAFLDLLFNAHRRIGKNVDWSELLETIKMIDDERLDQSYMLWTIVTEYTERLVVKGILSQQETKKLLKEMEKMQLWTLLTYDIVQNIKDTDSETYSKILGIKNVISFEEQLLSKPAETKEQLKRISDIIKSKEQLSKNDVLTLLIIDVISNVDYEQLINNFDGVIEGIMNTVKSAAQIFDIQKNTYSVFEYEQISKFVVDNHTIVVSPITDVAENIFEFISNSLNQFFFIKTLLNKVFGTKNLSSIMKDKKLLIATSKQQEENLQQVLQSNGIENIKVVTMEIITKPADGIRSDMVLDVQKGIRARYEDNKLIVYSKQGIDISTEDIQALIMQEYFAERSEDIVDKDVIAFADATDTTLDDITNRLKTSYTASVAMPNKETNFDLSSRVITNLATACKQEFVSTGIKTFIITQKQAEKFVSEIKFLQEEGFRFIISCKSDNIVDITIYDGMVIDATKIVDINQAMKFMDSIKRKVLTQGIAKQISVEFNDNIYNQFDNLKINIIDKYGIMPLLNASSQSLNLRNIGKYEVKNVTENNIDTLLRSNSVIGLVIDNARLFVGKKSIIKQLFSKEHKYNKVIMLH
ncbi:MAG: hypothetical protein IKN42_00415, partial [Elusimicrobia bacterium]|nr:hypothetical protein [Elusimicrobiota bacterium]